MQKSEFDKCRRNPSKAGRRCRIPARKFDRIRPDQWQDPAGSRPFWPDPTKVDRILVAGIRHWQDTDDQMLSDSGPVGF